MAMPMQRPRNDPPSRERIERMIGELLTESVAREHPVLSTQYIQAAIHALQWVIGDPEVTRSPITQKVLGRAPTVQEIYDETLEAADIIGGRQSLPDHIQRGDAMEGYEHHLHWAATGRGAPLDYDQPY